MIKMPTINKAKCDNCQGVAEYYFNEYGSTAPCDYCESSPINLSKII